MVTDDYYFSGYNSVNMNNCNYYEFSYCRLVVGEMVTAGMFGGDLDEVPNDFWVLVTQGSIAKYLVSLDRQLNKYKKSE